MRREELYLHNIVEAADSIADFTQGIDWPAFQRSEIHRSAIVYKLAIIGEAAAHICSELTARHPHVPWRQIVAFRNLRVHYFGIDWNEVWLAARTRVPELRDQVAAILTVEFGS